MRKARVVIASLMFVFLGAASGFAQDDPRQELETRLPHDFPVPADAVDVDNPDETKVECEVPGYSPERLLSFFRRELPKNGFTILAQNPPRVRRVESPVTIVFRNGEGRTRSVQIRANDRGDAIFIVS